MEYMPPPQTTKMKPLVEFTGLVGKCDNGHVLTPMTEGGCMGWAFCPDCATEAGGKYYDIYFVPEKGWNPKVKDWNPEE
tara:strand:+ start:7792 stop:8028 length:237 start_codon:yes stop_codon:yes gene_type:complete